MHATREGGLVSGVDGMVQFKWRFVLEDSLGEIERGLFLIKVIKYK